jgi:hypothetical protein
VRDVVLNAPQHYVDEVLETVAAINRSLPDTYGTWGVFLDQLPTSKDDSCQSHWLEAIAQAAQRQGMNVTGIEPKFGTDGRPTQEYAAAVIEHAKQRGGVMMLQHAPHTPGFRAGIEDAAHVRSMACLRRSSHLVREMQMNWDKNPSAASNPSHRNYYLAPSLASNWP